MSGKNKLAWFVPLSLALAVGAVTLPVAPASAQAPAIEGYSLIKTEKIRKFVKNPPKPGRGSWKLKADKSRKYFVADDLVNKNVDRSLDSSKVVKEDIETTPDVNTIEKIPGKTKVTENTREVDGNKSVEKRVEGRFVSTYQKWKIAKIKDTEKRTPYEEWLVAARKERKRQTLENRYRVKTELTFQDPKTKAKMKAATEALENPVTEYRDLAWEDKTARNFKGNFEQVENGSETLSTRDVEKRLTRQPDVALGSETVGSISSDYNVARSGETSAGSSAARTVSVAKAQKLAGSQNVQSKGGSRLDLDPLFAAAKAGPSLVDERGGKWTLSTDGKSLFLLPAGGEAFKLEKGKLSASGKDGKVKIESAQVEGGRIILKGEFELKIKGDSRASQTLRTAL